MSGAFQLDECSNSKRVADQCNAGGKAEVRRWPPARSGQKDHVWFPEMLTADAPVLTWDFTIMLEEINRKALPRPNSGMIVVKPDKTISGFGEKHAMPIIEKFKAAFPDWHVTDWSNVYLQLSEKSVYICDFNDENLANGTRIDYEDENFVELVKAAISKAKISALPEP